MNEKVLEKPSKLDMLSCLDINRRSMTMLGNCGPQLLWQPGTAAPRWDGTAKNTGEGSVPHTWPLMLQCKVLIREAASVDGLPSCAIVVGEVASLHTE